MAALAIGGVGIWMMHFIAMVGFTVTAPTSPTTPHYRRSFAAAVGAVGVGLFVSGGERAGWPRLILGGLVCGAGVVGMHYMGMAAVATGGRVVYDPVAGRGIGGGRGGRLDGGPAVHGGGDRRGPWRSRRRS